MRFDYPEGATPIDENEAAGLIPGHITTQPELNEWENQNILHAEQWGFSRRRRDILSLGFVQELHRRMFDETWQWAGQFRRSDKNIGVAWEQISVEVRKLLDDVRFWLEASTYSIQESAVRLHHRLVWIHPFVNGNGRHARLYADLVLYNHGLPRIDWGGGSGPEGPARKQYIEAMRAADRGDYGPLLSYAGVQ